jgi:hypothetical protein
VAATQFKGVALEVGLFSICADPQKINVIQS